MSEGLSRAQLRDVEAILDRVEDRLHDAPDGWHRAGAPASPELLEASGLPEASTALWARWNGLWLALGEVTVLPLEQHATASARAREQGLCEPEDRVIGERGRDLLVLPADPWEEGADVVLVDEDGERNPYASTVSRLVLAELGELAVLYDEEGEFRGDLFSDETGELTEVAERKLVRRRLDLDPDAPMARFRLGQLLARAGELRGSVTELRGALKRAPGYAWARFELGRVLVRLEDGRAAERAFVEAADAAADDGMRGLCLAWAARASEGEARAAHAAAALAAYPGLVAAHEAGAREAFEDGQLERARELLELGLAVNPRQLGLLDLARALSASTP